MSSVMNKKPTIEYKRPDNNTTSAQRNLIFQIASVISKWQAIYIKARQESGDKEYALKLEKATCNSDYDVFSLTCKAVRKLLSFYCGSISSIVSLKCYKHSNRDKITLRCVVLKDKDTIYRIEFSVSVCAGRTYTHTENKTVCFQKRAI